MTTAPRSRGDHRPRLPDRGSMTVEAAFLVVLLVVPLFYLVGTLGRLQAGAYAASAAAREAGRAAATAEAPEQAMERARAAAGLVLEAHGFDQGQGTVTLACGTEECLAPGSTVVADAAVVVALPLVPDFVRGAVPAQITLTARHTEPVDEFREAG